MNSFAAFLLVLTIAIPTTSCAWFGTCVKVKDGDTLWVTNPYLSEKVFKKKGGAFQVQLWGINCPEKKALLSDEAKAYTEKMVKGKSVEVRVAEQGYDPFWRVVADVRVNGKSLNQELVRSGYAIWSKKYAPGDRDFEALEEEAREAKRGLWGLDEPPRLK